MYVRVTIGKRIQTTLRTATRSKRLIAELWSAVTHAHHCVHSDNSVRFNICRVVSYLSRHDCNVGVLQAIKPRPMMTGAEGSCLIEYFRKLTLIPS